MINMNREDIRDVSFFSFSKVNLGDKNSNGYAAKNQDS